MSSKEKVKQIKPDAAVYVKTASRLMNDKSYMIVSGNRVLSEGRTKRIAWNNAVLELT